MPFDGSLVIESFQLTLKFHSFIPSNEQHYLMYCTSPSLMKLRIDYFNKIKGLKLLIMNKPDYRAPNRAKILLDKYYILVVFILTLLWPRGVDATPPPPNRFFQFSQKWEELF